MIRAANAADAQRLRDVERSAGTRFRDVGMPDIADAEPMSVERLMAYAEEGRSWVVTDDADLPVGFVVVDVVEDGAHIEELCVEPNYQRRGYGRALIDRVDEWAREQGLRALTLTTFCEVPWNRPLYERLGFRALADHELSDTLRRIREHEGELGIDPSLRVCMARSV